MVTQIKWNERNSLVWLCRKLGFQGVIVVAVLLLGIVAAVSIVQDPPKGGEGLSYLPEPQASSRGHIVPSDGSFDLGTPAQPWDCLDPRYVQAVKSGKYKHVYCKESNAK